MLWPCGCPVLLLARCVFLFFSTCHILLLAQPLARLPPCFHGTPPFLFPLSGFFPNPRHSCLASSLVLLMAPYICLLLICCTINFDLCPFVGYSKLKKITR